MLLNDKEYLADIKIVQRSVAQLPWRHNIVLMDKIQDADERNWYISKIYENGWSSDFLLLQINSELYKRQPLTMF